MYLYCIKKVNNEAMWFKQSQQTQEYCTKDFHKDIVLTETEGVRGFLGLQIPLKPHMLLY